MTSEKETSLYCCKMCAGEGKFIIPGGHSKKCAYCNGKGQRMLPRDAGVEGWYRADELHKQDLLTIAKHSDNFGYDKLAQEHPYVRGFRHGLVAGVRRALLDPDFTFSADDDADFNEEHPLWYKAYDAISKQFRERESRLLDNIKNLENKLEWSKKDAEEEIAEAYENGKADGGSWSLT